MVCHAGHSSERHRARVPGSRDAHAAARLAVSRELVYSPADDPTVNELS
jgi:hypothetical protein